MTKVARVADACLEYDALKPGSGQRVTLGKVAKKYTVSANDLYNFRRGIRATKASDPKGADSVQATEEKV